MAEYEIFITAENTSILFNVFTAQAQEGTENVLQEEMNITSLGAQSKPMHRSENYFYNSRFVIELNLISCFI
jgi:hypothetical protein